MKIIYPYEGNAIAIISPTGELPFKEVARKDVPAGIPYLFVHDSAFPQDIEFIDAWTADFTNPDGYGIGPEAWFEEQAQKAGTK